MTGRKPIVVVGSINTDLVAVATRLPSAGETVIGTDFQIHPGGKGANQAVAISRLGYPVRLIGRIGSDTFGAQLRTHLESSGVDIAGVATSEGNSGIATIVVSQQGENSIVVTPGANSKVAPHDLDTNIEIIRQAGIVLAQLEIPIETVEYLSLICSRANVSLILDPAPATELPSEVFKRAAWFTPNQVEAAFYSKSKYASDIGIESVQELAKQILSKGNSDVILKMGAHGAYLARQNGEECFVPAPRVQAVDTTAAGDVFNGAFAVGLMLGKDPRESAQFATAAAAISVTRAGAQPSMPDASEVESLLANNLNLVTSRQ